MHPVHPDHVNVLKRLGGLEPAYDETWLGTNPSLAFLTCVAMGPWKHNRREKVRADVLAWYGDTGDLFYGPWTVPPYPFKWQQITVARLQDGLKRRGRRLFEMSLLWRGRENWERAVRDFFTLCGRPEGTKVLWLFVRDFLKLPAFPIDRWVRRNLQTLGLPADPWYLIAACQEAGVNPNKVARLLFAGEKEAP